MFACLEGRGELASDQGEKHMLSPMILAGIGDIFSVWQIPLVILLIAVIIFYVLYKKRQM